MKAIGVGAIAILLVFFTACSKSTKSENQDESMIDLAIMTGLKWSTGCACVTPNDKSYEVDFQLRTLVIIDTDPATGNEIKSSKSISDAQLEELRSRVRAIPIERCLGVKDLANGGHNRLSISTGSLDVTAQLISNGSCEFDDKKSFKGESKAFEQVTEFLKSI